MAKRAVITGRHLYGFGGGAQATLWFARALNDLNYETSVYSMLPVSQANARLLGQEGIGVANYYRGCSLRADLLLNIDHFVYEKPLAKLNAFHIFHPHGDNRPPQGYQLGSANSQYTAFWTAREWGLQMPALYIPIGTGFYQGRKEPVILHVSRFAPPTELADKGHAQMIQAFKYLCDSGIEGWRLAIAGSLEDANYFANLRAQATGYPIQFYPNIADRELEGLYASSAIYWHATGISLPEVHGAQEHLGLTTIEAMAAGCVPVVYSSGGQQEIINNGETGYLCHNAFTIGNITGQLISDLSTWSRIQHASIEAAKPWQDYNAFLERVDAWLSTKSYAMLPASKPKLPEFSPNAVCAVIPAYGAADMTVHLVRKIAQTQPDLGQLLVIDNASPIDQASALERTLDDLRERGMNVTLVKSDVNLGFAGALDLATQFTELPLLLALNNDMLPAQDGWLDLLLEALTEGVGVVGAKLIYPDGRLQHAGGAMDFGRSDIGYHRWYGEEDQPAANQREAVDFVTGACLLARRSLWRWEDWGGYGYEDLDLCLEARKAGWTVVYQPASVLVHYESVTRLKVPGAEPSGALTVKNRGAFVEKWYGWLLENAPHWLKGH